MPRIRHGVFFATLLWSLVASAGDAEQQRAAGIEVAHPRAATVSARIEALGVVLDPTALIADAGEVTVARAAEHAATAEAARLRGLLEGGAGASRKMLEAAQFVQAKAQVQLQTATARFALRWGPIAALSESERAPLLDAVGSGRQLLVRADIPGRHGLGIVPERAMIDVDGIQVSGRVLGAVRETTELQSAGLLVELQHAPVGLGAGARIAVTLLMTPRAGLVLPRDALLYDENGAYVYKQLASKSADEKTRYTAAKVKLLAEDGDGWLVDGVDVDDEIVVHGAGILWSLQGVATAADTDDDD